MSEERSFDFQDPEMEDLMRLVGSRIKSSIPNEMGFILFLFTEMDGENSNLFYISTENRVNAIMTLKAWMARQVT